MLDMVGRGMLPPAEVRHLLTRRDAPARSGALLSPLKARWVDQGAASATPCMAPLRYVHPRPAPLLRRRDGHLPAAALIGRRWCLRL
jgi:hypothetical protein